MKPNPAFSWSKAARFLVGMLVLIAGLALVLLWWNDVMVVFRGFIGVLLALGGVLILYLMQK